MCVCTDVCVYVMLVGLMRVCVCVFFYIFRVLCICLVLAWWLIFAIYVPVFYKGSDDKLLLPMQKHMKFLKPIHMCLSLFMINGLIF